MSQFNTLGYPRREEKLVVEKLVAMEKTVDKIDYRTKSIVTSLISLGTEISKLNKKMDKMEAELAYRIAQTAQTAQTE